MSSIISSFALLAFGLGQAPTAFEVENRFVKARRAMVSGTVLMRVDYEDSIREPLKKKFERRMWFTPERYRCDETLASDKTPMRELYCENCERDQQFPAAGNTASFSGSLRVGVRNRFRHDNSLASLFCRAQRDLPWMPTR
ncbi:MAG: hypothetical protein HYX68_19430, partial [Planctomycetes bacterium]|nr:hypothetical protein [Planctomycetota bacterium]